MKKWILLLMMPLLLMGEEKNIAQFDIHFKALFNHPKMAQVIAFVNQKMDEKKIKFDIKPFLKMKHLKISASLSGFIMTVDGLNIKKWLSEKFQPVAVKDGIKISLSEKVMLYQYKDQLMLGTATRFKDNHPVSSKNYPELDQLISKKAQPVWDAYLYIPDQIRLQIQKLPLTQFPPQIQTALKTVTAVSMLAGTIEGKKDQFQIKLYLPKKEAQQLQQILKQLHQQSISMVKQMIQTSKNQLDHHLKLFPHYDQYLFNVYQNITFSVDGSTLRIQTECEPSIPLVALMGIFGAVAIPIYQKEVSQRKKNLR